MRAIGFIRTNQQAGSEERRIFKFGEIPAVCILDEIDPPHFDPESEKFRLGVLIRVDAFSCNYRDIGIIVSSLRSAMANPFILFGSEISGTVVATGRDVVDLRPGDRVITDNSYPVPQSEPYIPGVPANHVSCELLVLPCSKIFKIPDSIPVETAAAMSLNGQTAYSVVRRISCQAGDPVLITAGRANVSLMLLNALRVRNIPATVLTSADGWSDRFKEIGAAEVHVVKKVETGGGISIGSTTAEGWNAKFKAIFDPYCDVYLSHVIGFLRVFGTYIFCGSAQQAIPLPAVAAQDDSEVFQRWTNIALLRNLSIVGNCLGIHGDLAEVVRDVESDYNRVVIDSVYGEGQESEFAYRTFFDLARFGKVVYRFPP